MLLARFIFLLTHLVTQGVDIKHVCGSQFMFTRASSLINSHSPNFQAGQAGEPPLEDTREQPYPLVREPDHILKNDLSDADGNGHGTHIA